MNDMVAIIRPTWHETHMLMAILASKRSCDTNTKVGSVIVDPYNHLLATGFNSFPRGFPDHELPNARGPNNAKEMFVHSELNSLINCMVSPFTFPQGVTLYSTVRPCVRCLGALINANVTTIYSLANTSWSRQEEESELFFRMLRFAKINYEEMEIKWTD